jgi:GntR family transcriptional regulator/MocR family aminotransferase
LLGNAWLRGDLGRGADPAGYGPLREALARYLAQSRGVVCSPDQVVVVNGTQQTLDLLARIWLDPGQRVALESPGYPGVRHAFQAYGAEILSLPVDAEGAQVDRLASMHGVRLVSVTPSHQYPTGAVLSLERRLRLLDWAARSGALVLEDDYDSEFRFAGRPLASLQGLDRGSRVVYLGTFSTVLLPPLRLGYAVLPADLVEPFALAKSLADSQTAVAEQWTLAEMLRQGHFARHLRRTRRLYQERRAALLAGLERRLAGVVTWRDAGAGLHLMVTLRPGLSEVDAARRAAEVGISVGQTAPCWVGAPEYAALLLGYAALPAERIEPALQRLARALASS